MRTGLEDAVRNLFFYPIHEERNRIVCVKHYVKHGLSEETKNWSLNS